MKNIPSPLSRAFPLLIILIVGVLCYSNTFHSPFQLDEKHFIEENPVVKDLHYYIDPSGVEGTEWRGALRTRYVGLLSFALNYKLHGFDVTGYHVFNVSVHILNAMLVYFLVILAFRTPFLSGSSLASRPAYVALLAALLFVAHPLQTEAVTYVYQRLASLVAFFYLLSLTAYVRSSLSRGRARRYALYLVCMGSAVLAMKTKENAFTLPFMIALLEFLFFKGSVKGRAMRLLPVMLTLLVIPLSMAGAGAVAGGGVNIPRGNIAVSRWDYLFTQFTVVLTYLRLLFVPVGQNLDYDYPLYDSFLQPQVVLSFLVILSVMGAGLYLLYRSREKAPELRLVSFGVLWFFVALSVESSIIPLHTVINEYRVYLPGVGVFIAFSTGAFLLASKIPRHRPRNAAYVFLFLLPVVLGGAAYARNMVWRSEVSLWEDVVRKSPDKARGHQNLGNAYLSSGRFEEAIEHSLISLSIRPLNIGAIINLANAYFDAGMVEKAAGQFERALELREHYPAGEISVEDLDEINYNLGMSYYSMGMTDRAIERYLEAVRLNPGNSDAHNNLGAAYFEKGFTDKAIASYHAALRADPGNDAAYINLGEAYLKKGMPGKAMENIKVYLRFHPDEPEANRMRAEANKAMGKGEKALPGVR